MQAKVFDDTLDTSGADLQAGLSDFLSDHSSGGVRVKESMSNNLTSHLLGAAV